ncbi:MAG: HNH endonuclease [Rickettsiales bacterium]|jgi:CRISPR-associated endonuclease Csn1|nr:HNH endonuclease [Rickettsiales bacterium]
MKYRLGLDLGVGSIGAAVIRLDNENNPTEIIDAGVRIFEVSEGAEDRRLKRTIRKNTIRTRQRMKLLAQLLFDNGLYPTCSPDGTDKLRRISPYEIRARALDEKINPFWFGRAILHLAKHRGAGYINQMQEADDTHNEDDEKPKKSLSPYDMMEKHLADSGARTIGEFLLSRINDKSKRIVRQKNYDGKPAVDYAIPRWLVRDEFDKICKQQEITPGLKQKIEYILFYELPSMPWAIGKCIYIADENRLSKAHPLSEQRRIYEEVNNVSKLTDTGKEKLSKEERDKIITELLLAGKSAGKKSIKELLGLKQSELSVENPIKPYLYSLPQFRDLDITGDLIEFISNPVDPTGSGERLYSNGSFIKIVGEKLGIADDVKIEIILAKIPKGRTNLGKTATETILEKLKTSVITHREITDELAKTDPRFMAPEERVRMVQGSCNLLPYYGKILTSDTQPVAEHVKKRNPTLNQEEKQFGKIANPGVHMILNQLRLVVNDIIRLYGKPYEINIEVGRDVGLSPEQKAELEKRQKSNRSDNEEARQHLANKGLPITRKNILKYKLAKEQGWADAYAPQNSIPQDFNSFEIEHIIPQKLGGTDTYNNLVLVNATDNRAKTNSFPYPYFEKSKTPEEIREILKNARKRLKDKSWRFEPDAEEKFRNFGDSEETNRYLTDTRYVSKLAMRYLRAILNRNVDEAGMLAIRGAQTAKLRHVWNLDGLEYDLLNMDVPRYLENAPKRWMEKNTGIIKESNHKPDIDGEWKEYKTKNKEWFAKPRIDHRHHAMDAIVAAFANRSLLQRMVTETEDFHSGYPAPLDDFRTRVINTLRNIKISHKPEHSKPGQLHKETGRVILCENGSSALTVYRRKISVVIKKKDDLAKLLIPENIKSELHESIASARVAQHELYDNFLYYWDFAKLELQRESQENLARGGKDFQITDARIIARTLRLIRNRGLWKDDKFRQYENNNSLIKIEKHGVAYESGNNHCVDFYISKKGKIGWEVINRFNANQPDFVPKWKRDGGRIIWSVHQGDIMELNTPQQWKKYTSAAQCLARVKKFSKGKFDIDFISDARMTSPKDKSIKYMFVDTIETGLKNLVNWRARKIELTSFGKVKKKHKVLNNGAKSSA